MKTLDPNVFRSRRNLINHLIDYAPTNACRTALMLYTDTEVLGMFKTSDDRTREIIVRVWSDNQREWILRLVFNENQGNVEFHYSGEYDIPWERWIGQSPIDSETIFNGDSPYEYLERRNKEWNRNPKKTEISILPTPTTTTATKKQTFLSRVKHFITGSRKDEEELASQQLKNMEN